MVQFVPSDDPKGKREFWNKLYFILNRGTLEFLVLHAITEIGIFLSRFFGPWFLNIFWKTVQFPVPYFFLEWFSNLAHGSLSVNIPYSALTALVSLLNVPFKSKESVLDCLVHFNLESFTKNELQYIFLLMSFLGFPKLRNFENNCEYSVSVTVKYISIPWSSSIKRCKSTINL